MKKVITLFLLIGSLSFANKISLISSARNEEIKNQIFQKNAQYEIYSKPLMLTAINLRTDGEEVIEMSLGDKDYWRVDVANGNQILITSLAPPPDYTSGLPAMKMETSLFVVTNKDKYYFKLISSEKFHNPVINMLYPQDIALRQVFQEEEDNKFVKLSMSNIEDLNQNYRWTKKYSWSPTQIVDDGKKTYIFLSLEDKDIPSFYIKKDGELEIALFRINENRNGQKVLVVDKIFKDASLVLHKREIKIRNKNRR